MLELRGITKIYPAGDGVVEALKGIDLSFRKCEFVSILGPSGCGKTTMLNIIGGLDKYTKGDLLINNRSTESYKDKDWDAYRNHSIGFVFQSYNLIPHQSVLQNVEIALTVSGISKHERKKRAKKALEDVGLGSQLNKKPSELSGGQMQRVAIARAIVNNPDIILADEPTGALDTETSIQVLDILKEISKDRLVIMVTHNPDLAEKYSTRIIKMLDGLILDDSDPITDKEAEKEKEEGEKRDKENRSKKKPSMSFFTAFGLSLKNLFTKKSRTILTSFAGSIGIIGIALIYSVSNGTTAYIADVQEEALSSMPLTIEARPLDMSSIMEVFLSISNEGLKHEKDAVYQQGMVHELANALSDKTTENDLRAFKEYLETGMKDENDATGLKNSVSGIHYTYDLNMPVYTVNDGKVIESDLNRIMRSSIVRATDGKISLPESTDTSDSGTSLLSAMMGSSSSRTKLWQEMIPGKNGETVSPLMKNQYELIDEGGRWPESYDEVVLFVDKNNELNDYALYALGLMTEEEINAMVDAFKAGEKFDPAIKHWPYEEIKSRTFRTFLPSECYVMINGVYTDLRKLDSEIDGFSGIETLYKTAKGIDLKVVGIARSTKDSSSIVSRGAIGYTTKLTNYIIEESKKSPAVTEQQANPNKDILTGKYFRNNDFSDSEKAESFRNYVNVFSEIEKAEIYINIKCIAPQEMIDASFDKFIGDNINDKDWLLNYILENLSSFGISNSSMIEEAVKAMSLEELQQRIRQVFDEGFKKNYAEQVRAGYAGADPKELAKALDAELQGYTDKQCVQYYDETLDFSDSTYEKVLIKLGLIDLDNPSTIELYASTFNDKDTIEQAIEKYNSTKDELQQITYTDYVGMILDSITTIINAVTYVLIAFVSISLIVSSIMIGVITLISVQERTKEIGILRAIGASKRDVSSMFNAETVIIGFTSGALGVIITYLICIPINIVLHSVTKIDNLSASLPLLVGAVLTLISTALTLVSGIIPSRSAAKKDPVVALRTE